MAKESKSARTELVATSAAPDDVLGPPPLTRLDDKAAFARLEAALVAQVKPQGIVEQLRLRDVANLVWEAQRLRRARAVVLMLARREAISKMLTDVSEKEDPDEFPWEIEQRKHTVLSFLAGDDSEAVAAVEAALQRLGLDATAIEGAALQLALKDVERLDQLIFQADQRRDAVLRDLERAKEARTRALAEAAAAIDAEFEDAEADEAAEADEDAGR